VDSFLGSKSAEYLTSTGQLSDLDFILEHIDDVNAVFASRTTRSRWCRSCTMPFRESEHQARAAL